MIRFDHFIYGVQDLEKGREEFEKLTGVRPELGGQHPKIGTHNALASLGESYFELIALDPSLNPVAHPFADGLRKLKHPTIVGWAIQADHFSEIEAAVNKASFSLSEIGSGSRMTPSGQLLQYEFANFLGIPEPSGDPSVSLLPFAVRWRNVAHPASTAPTGCRLRGVSLTHLPHAEFSRLLESLNLGIAISQGSKTRLQVEIESPKGLHTLG